jgi:diguanylate cyclase (GGDEF)-like protein
MPKLQNDLVNSLLGGDILFAYRKRIWTLIGTVCICVFLPGSVYVFFSGYRLLAAAVIFMLASFALNGLSRVRKKAGGVTMAIFLASLIFVIGLCIVQRGVGGAFWIYPGALMINFLSFGRRARIYTAIFSLFMIAAMFYALDPEIAARATVGLIVTITITNIFLGMIDRLQKKLVEQSSLDPLTGALNRREMDSILGDSIERKRRTNTPASLIVFDVDQFKSVNDTYGHAVGDHVLKELVSRVSARARILDHLFRLGGEEFILFLPDTDCSGAITLGEELRKMVAETSFINERKITVSIGISELASGETIDQWIKRGDDALFKAKNNGRNQVVAADHGFEDTEAAPVPAFHVEHAQELIAA